MYFIGGKMFTAVPLSKYPLPEKYGERGVKGKLQRGRRLVLCLFVAAGFAGNGILPFLGLGVSGGWVARR